MEAGSGEDRKAPSKRAAAAMAAAAAAVLAITVAAIATGGPAEEPGGTERLPAATSTAREAYSSPALVPGEVSGYGGLQERLGAQEAAGWLAAVSKALVGEGPLERAEVSVSTADLGDGRVFFEAFGLWRESVKAGDGWTFDMLTEDVEGANVEEGWIEEQLEHQAQGRH